MQQLLTFKQRGDSWRHMHGNSGLTLIELMIAVAISGFVIAAIVMSFKAQQRSSAMQQDVSAMQQNMRAAVYLMGSDIKMAGYDPTEKSGAGIITAAAANLNFTMDLNEDGDVTDTGENITYYLYTAVGDNFTSLGRDTGAPTSVAEHIEDLEFRYLDSDNNTTATPADIRSITITLLARSRIEDPDYINTNIYTTASGVAGAAPNDGFRRRQLITRINCRNMGI